MSILTDIINNLSRNDLFNPLKDIINDLTQYECDYDINDVTLMKLYACRYTIGEYCFEYSHYNTFEGYIKEATFTIQYDNNKHIFYKYDDKYHSTNGLEYDDGIWRKFMSDYPLQNDLTYYRFIAILNSFTTGISIAIYIDNDTGNYDVGPINLDCLICVYEPTDDNKGDRSPN